MATVDPCEAWSNLFANLFDILGPRSRITPILENQYFSDIRKSKEAAYVSVVRVDLSLFNLAYCFALENFAVECFESRQSFQKSCRDLLHGAVATRGTIRMHACHDFLWHAKCFAD